MGREYLPPWMADFYGFHVGEYTSPMDMGNEALFLAGWSGMGWGFC